ncbi:Probable efflux pump outer membrane protein ttgC precursor [Hafnia alvei]|uniref:Probable efflux pump outer membrane protein ttgC n=1 Tax=Hafnia alvei TaxID=569 RepID=A0A377PHA1_HAFAL|nr:Probable efflux pump outer membrane protein ttgC precursor [Hafnia alvei]
MKLHYVISIILLLSGCGNLTRSDYQRPQLSYPTQWQKQMAQDPNVLASESENWWQGFNDPRLTRVVNQVLASNNDLAAAAITLQQARVAAGLTNTNLTPDVSLGGSASNSQSVRHHSAAQESYAASLSINYELDLWGKLARVREQGEWQATASEQDYRGDGAINHWHNRANLLDHRVAQSADRQFAR